MIILSVGKQAICRVASSSTNGKNTFATNRRRNHNNESWAEIIKPTRYLAFFIYGSAVSTTAVTTTTTNTTTATTAFSFY